MVRHIDAIFSQGAFRPLVPLTLREGMRVHLSVVEQEPSPVASPVLSTPKIHTPRLAHPEDAGDFVMEVREVGDADCSSSANPFADSSC
jgi:predicted DNA-binding antitoxin AbrB/MazE fold protein